MMNDIESLFNKSSSIIKNDVVVGLSGGPDSIFLLYYIKYLKEHFGFSKSVFPIIVDHRLRIESYNEALKTKKIATMIGFNSKIIKIKDKYIWKSSKLGKNKKKKYFIPVCTKIFS